MSKYTKTLIASAMAVAVAGPVAADVPDNLGERYEDGRATIRIQPSGCKNNSTEFQAVVGFGDIFEDDGIDFESTPFAGCWAMTGYQFGDIGFAYGGRIARKVDTGNSDSRGDAREVTMSLSADTFYDGIVDAMDNYLQFHNDAANCNYDALGGALTLANHAVLRQGRGKFSKNQERLNVDIRVDSRYERTDGKMRNVNARIRARMDAAVGENPAFDCGLFFVEPLPPAPDA